MPRNMSTITKRIGVNTEHRGNNSKPAKRRSGFVLEDIAGDIFTNSTVFGETNAWNVRQYTVLCRIFASVCSMFDSLRI